MAHTIEVVVFTGLKTLNIQNIREAWDQLYHLVAKQGKRKVLLNLAGIEQISCEALSEVFLLQRMLKNLGGMLVVCNASHEIVEILDRSHSHLEIRNNNEAAYLALQV